MKFDLHSDQRLRLAKEMYLKAIYQLSQDTDSLKQSDLVSSLGVSKSSVNEMVKKLIEEGYLQEGSVNLTLEGVQFAKQVLRKYDVLFDFFHNHLKLSDAHDEACNVEHACTVEMIEKLEAYLLIAKKSQ